MSLFRTLDRTTCTSAVSHAGHHARPRLTITSTFPCPVLYEKQPSCRSFSNRVVNRPPLTSSADYMDNFFIQALARAGSCPEHAKQISSFRNVASFHTAHHKTRRRGTWPSHERREFKSKAARVGPFKKVKQFAQKELKALVDYYGIEFDTRPDEDVLDDGPLIWNVGDDHEPWPVRNSEDAEHIHQLEQHLQGGEISPEHLFATYKLLPSPGVVYLRTKTIRALLHHLSVVERASPAAMHRFLSILDDMKNAHIHIIRSEWTSAIYFAGRFTGKVSADEVQSALYIWRDMEKRAGVKSGVVTLNVLFDVAVKAGKYTLAETFLKELQARKLKMHRHFRVSLIYYYGVLQNGNEVRRAYQDLVEAGDIVDTVVMNAVIAALMRAGEPAAAEHVFERMKRLHAASVTHYATHKPFINQNWRQRRLVGLHLTHEVRKYASDSEKLKALQNSASIAPDSRTYGILIRHHASTAGNIDRVNDLLQEMRYNSIPIDGTIFIVIFYGFNTFGGVRYSSWTRDKLEKIWAEYLQAVKDKRERTWFSSMAVIAALKAFKKCTDAERTLRAWEEVMTLWKPSEDETEKVLRVLRRLIPQASFFSGNATDEV